MRNITPYIYNDHVDSRIGFFHLSRKPIFLLYKLLMVNYTETGDIASIEYSNNGVLWYFNYSNRLLYRIFMQYNHNELTLYINNRA